MKTTRASCAFIWFLIIISYFVNPTPTYFLKSDYGEELLALFH